MHSRLDIYNWSPVFISQDMKKVGFRLDYYTVNISERRDRCASVLVFTVSLLFAL